MKKLALVPLLALLALVAPLAQDLPRLGLAPLASSSYDATKLALLTEAFRSELFKTGLFSVQDKPWAPGATGFDKGATGGVERFGTSWMLNLKVTDLKTGAVEFSEVVSVSDEALLFRTIKELTAQLASRYRLGVSSATLSPDDARSRLEALWAALGAEGQALADLTALGDSPEVYLTFRQYDGSITPAAYLDLKRQAVDLNVLQSLLQAGISYRDARRAMGMGITQLAKYQAEFQPVPFSFAEYLDAYELGLSSAAEYKKYLAASERDFLSVGLGGVADRIPITTTEFKFLIGQVAWEHSWLKNPKDWYRVNTEAGLILLGLFLPTPYFGINVMAGSAPFFVKAGIGGHAEMLVGGHAAVNFRLGIEVASRFEFTLLAVPIGNEPVVNYVGGFQKWEGGPDGPIKFPYFGLLFTYKFPLSGGVF